MIKKLLLLAIVALSFTACDEDDGGNGDAQLQSVEVRNLHAPADERDHQTGEIITKNDFVFFSLSTQAIVDSASNEWDLAFKGTTIRTNSGVSGAGNGGAVIVNSLFEEVVEAPADNTFDIDANGSFAIPAGSGNGWYNYNPALFTIAPIPGRVIVVRTHDGKYAKLEIQSYYKDAPETVDPFTDESDFYTFRYVYRSDGSKKFE